jgi:hypothetical protein
MLALSSGLAVPVGEDWPFATGEESACSIGPSEGATDPNKPF